MTHFEIQNATASTEAPVVVHIPHSSTFVPPEFRTQLLVDEETLESELLKMTDHFTDELYGEALELGATCFVNRLSRLVMDPERFRNDADEEMAAKGMGAIYLRTSQGGPLRSERFLTEAREDLLSQLFDPYAEALSQLVERKLEHFGRCLIIDGHSFPTDALPYEDASRARPDICVGFEPFHCAERITKACLETIEDAGLSAGANTPFAGSYVPLRYYRRNNSVQSLMLETRRGLYMDEATGKRLPVFTEMRALVGQVIERAMQAFESG